MRTKIPFSAIATFLCGLLVAGATMSNPAPLSCTTSGGSWTVSLAPANPSSGSPYAANCMGQGNVGNICTVYNYVVNNSPGKSLGIDHLLIAASADQVIDYTNVSASVAQLGAGDSKTGYLAYVQSEYAIRLNPTSLGSPNTVMFVGSTIPRTATVVVTKGKTIESCLIASAGMAGDPFQPRFTSQTAMVAGGKCKVNLTFDALGNVSDVNLAGDAHPSCVKTVGPVTIGNEVLRNNSGPHGITFGNNTTTCYGPPVPSVPRCISR